MPITTTAQTRTYKAFKTPVLPEVPDDTLGWVGDKDQQTKLAWERMKEFHRQLLEVLALLSEPDYHLTSTDTPSKTEVTTIENNVTNVTEQVTQIDNSVTNITQSITIIQQLVSGIETDLSALEARIVANEQDIDVIEAALPGLQPAFRVLSDATTYTPTADDNGCFRRVSTAVTLATTGIPIGWSIAIRNTSASSITVSGSGQTVRYGLSSIDAGGQAVLIYVAANEWELGGDVA